MTRIACWIWLPLLSIVAGCTDGAEVTPLEPEAWSSRAEAEAATCFTPEFTVHLMPIVLGTVFAEVSGDLEGTAMIEFDLPGSLRFAGATIHNAGSAEWMITGGIVPDLETFQTEFENMNINVDRPGSPPETFENVGRHRATAGVRTANLTYKGTFVASSSPEGLHHYRGVICP